MGESATDDAAAGLSGQRIQHDGKVLHPHLERVFRDELDQISDLQWIVQQYEDKHRVLNESGNFLIETVEEPVAAEIKQTLLMLNRRFKDLVEQYTHYKQVEVVGKARKEYNEGLLRLTQWLKGAEDLLAQEVPCKHALLKEYLNELDVSL